MIEVEKLTKYYGERVAVQDLSFQVGKGEIVGLLGPNGAGKTTTMRMLTGYLPFDSGKAIVAGYDVAQKPMEVRKRLGYLPETVPLYTEMPVDAYLDFIAKIRGVPAKGRKRRIQEVMELCRISDVATKLIGKLSRGYRQRVGLAQAIVHNPPVIILDEPTVGLDPRQIIEIRKVIRDLAGNHSMILSTHILPEVSAVCDRVVIVNRGRVLVEDTLANLERRGVEGERLRIGLNAPFEEANQMLSAWPDVLSVTPHPETMTFDLKLNTGVDIREKLAVAIVERGWGLLELKNIAPSLEEIFVQLITDDLAKLEEEEAASQPEPLAIRKLIEDDEMDDTNLVLPADETGTKEDELNSEHVIIEEGTTPADAKRRTYVVEPKEVRKAAPSFLADDDKKPKQKKK